MSQATGRSILTASGGNQEALEGYRGHGLFTYELLEAVNEADGDRTGTVEVKELAASVYAKVTEQRQVSQMKITANYPLAKQTRVLQDENTPVAAAEPNYRLAQTAQLQIQPSAGGTVVRSLSAKTAVTVLESQDGWSLIAADCSRSAMSRREIWRRSSRSGYVTSLALCLSFSRIRMSRMLKIILFGSFPFRSQQRLTRIMLGSFVALA